MDLTVNSRDLKGALVFSLKFYTEVSDPLNIYVLHLEWKKLKRAL